jgi:hypothetical protein
MRRHRCNVESKGLAAAAAGPRYTAISDSPTEAPQRRYDLDVAAEDTVWGGEGEIQPLRAGGAVGGLLLERGLTREKRWKQP